MATSSRLGVATDDGAIDLGIAAHGRQVRVTLGVARVPVVIVGAGPTGVTAATLLAQYGIDSLVLDRWTDVYPQPRAVHLDDEVYRIVARLGIADEFAAISRPAHGLRLLDNTMRVLAEFRRDTALQRQRLSAGQHVRPARVRGAAAQQPQAPPPCRRCAATSRSPASPTRATDASGSRSPTAPTAASTPSRPTTCSAATAPTASCAPRIGSAMRDLEVRAALAGRRRRHRRRPRPVGGRAPGVRPATARAPTCGSAMPVTAGSFGCLPGETAEDYASLAALDPLIAPWTAHAAGRRAGADPRHRVHVPGADRRHVAARQRLSARRRRPSHPAVHRAGHGCRAAGCDEPVVEAGGGAGR